MDLVSDKINNSVICIAILNSRFLGSNILDAYIPFVSTLISVQKYDIVDVERICSDFYLKYFFKIPAMPMKEILSRMKRKKMIFRSKDGKMVPNYDKIFETDFENDYKENLIKYENILNKYIVFGKEKYDFDITKEKAEETFSKFIKENYLYAFTNNENIDNIIKKVQNLEVDKEEYILYKFIINLYKMDYESFKTVQRFCMGYVIANALNIDNGKAYNILFKEKKIFFDTKFIIRLLGLEGEFYQNSYMGIIETLKENKCKLFILSYTYDEIVNILNNAKMNINNTCETSSEVQKYFWNNKKTEGDIKVLIATLQSRLEKLNIYVSSIGYNNTNELYQIDEQGLYNEIERVYLNGKKNDSNLNEDMIWNDVKTMALIYRDLQGNRAYTIESLKDILITTNKGLAYACKNFGKIINNSEKVMVPCMTDIFLGTLLWIQNPIKYDEYNEKQILASCYAAVKPDNKAINKFSIELKKLKENNEITQEDYILTRNYDILESMLSDEIMGDSECIDEYTVYEVIEEVKKKITEDYENKLEEIKEEKFIQKQARNKAEKRYIMLNGKVKNDIRKRAIIEFIIKTLIILGISISIIMLDLYFNIIDCISSDNATLVRIILYVILAISSLISVISKVKNYKIDIIKLYKKKRKALGQ